MFILGQRIADFLARAFEVAHVDGAVRLGRRADAEEDDLGILDGGLHVVGELELPGGVVLLHQFLQARLEDRAVAVLKRLELLRVLLDAAHGVADAARQVPVTSPTYPQPMTVTSIGQILTLSSLFKRRRFVAG